MLDNSFIEKFRDFIPPVIRRIIRRNVALIDYNIYYRKKQNPYINEPDEVLYENSEFKIGICKEIYQYHKSYIAACRDLKISYRLIDITSTKWQENVENSGCDAFLVWPSFGLSVWKDMYDDRLRIMEEDMGKLVYPEPKALWLWENKMRTRDWLMAHDIPIPKTWIFYSKVEALKFAEDCNLPIVFKTNLGASATGVRIIRDKKSLQILIKKIFSKGIVAEGHHPNDSNWASLLLQEYLPGVEEWRMIRVGESYFGYRKEKVGDFHSGSHEWSWLDPGPKLLNFLKYVTDKGNFSSMDVDVFLKTDGSIVVNELQAVFGATTPAEMLKINDIEGRYIYDEGNWIFQEGSFSKNQCSNLRVEKLLSLIREHK